MSVSESSPAPVIGELYAWYYYVLMKSFLEHRADAEQKFSHFDALLISVKAIATSDKPWVPAADAYRDHQETFMNEADRTEGKDPATDKTAQANIRRNVSSLLACKKPWDGQPLEVDCLLLRSKGGSLNQLSVPNLIGENSDDAVTAQDHQARNIIARMLLFLFCMVPIPKSLRRSLTAGHDCAALQTHLSFQLVCLPLWVLAADFNKVKAKWSRDRLASIGIHDSSYSLFKKEDVTECIKVRLVVREFTFCLSFCHACPNEAIHAAM
jgi:hypothetical protein